MTAKTDASAFISALKSLGEIVKLSQLAKANGLSPDVFYRLQKGERSKLTAEERAKIRQGLEKLQAQIKDALTRL